MAVKKKATTKRVSPKADSTKTAPQPMYLVVSRHEMDDLPLFMSPDKQIAIGFAQGCDPMGSKATRKVMGTDCSTPICVVVVEFWGGEPDSIVYQKVVGRDQSTPLSDHFLKRGL